MGLLCEISEPWWTETAGYLPSSLSSNGSAYWGHIVPVPTLYPGCGIGKWLVFSVQRSLDQEETCRPVGKMAEHFQQILDLKLDVATGRDFGGGVKRIVCRRGRDQRGIWSPEWILSRDSAHQVFCVLSYTPQLSLQLDWGHVTSSSQWLVKEVMCVFLAEEYAPNDIATMCKRGPLSTLNFTQEINRPLLH